MSLKNILTRLLTENLHGPCSPWSTPPGTIRRQSSGEFADLDSHDPR